jgi:hypothetical protein
MNSGSTDVNVILSVRYAWAQNDMIRALTTPNY